MCIRDRSFVNKIKSYRDTKLIIFVQDIQKLMFDSEQAILDMEIRTLNKADLLDVYKRQRDSSMDSHRAAHSRRRLITSHSR